MRQGKRKFKKKKRRDVANLFREEIKVKEKLKIVRLTAPL